MRLFTVLLLLPFFIFSQNLEVCLPIRSSLVPAYLSFFLEESSSSKEILLLQEILKKDLLLSASLRLIEQDPLLEKTVQETFQKEELALSIFQKTNIPLFLVGKVVKGKLKLFVFDLLRQQIHTYFPVSLTRGGIHKLSDRIQKDLFGKEGICSSMLIYTIRSQKGPGKKGWISEVWVSDYDGFNARQLTKENSYCFCPSFVPGSSEFIYSSEKTGQSKIYKASLSSPEGRPIIDLRGNQALACVKGAQMAFIADTSGRPDLFIQYFDSLGSPVGSPRQLFSSPRATQASPSFSPDGQKVAFVSDKDGPPRIYTLDVVETKIRRKAYPQLITKRNRENTSPSWSPDGTKLAYSAKVEGVRQIWVYDFIKEEEMAITEGPFHKENPSWASDSFHLVYNTEDEEACDLYLIDLDQKKPTCIGPGRFASWNL